MATVTVLRRHRARSSFANVAMSLAGFCSWRGVLRQYVVGTGGVAEKQIAALFSETLDGFYDPLLLPKPGLFSMRLLSCS